MRVTVGGYKGSADYTDFADYGARDLRAARACGKKINREVEEVKEEKTFSTLRLNIPCGQQCGIAGKRTRLAKRNQC
jgi:hypothetical protein